MTHLSENCNRLKIEKVTITEKVNGGFPFIKDIALLILPSTLSNSKEYFSELIRVVTEHMGDNSTLITIGETIELVQAHANLSSLLNYHLWIAIQRSRPVRNPEMKALPENHFGALVHTKYSGSLQHTKTRTKYTYCPACEKTTKDYGGKKHTYNSYGTLISDIWRDISADLDDNLDCVIERFADLFGIEGYRELLVFDYRNVLKPKSISEPLTSQYSEISYLSQPIQTFEESKLILGDSIEELRKLPDNSIDFAFAYSEPHCQDHKSTKLRWKNRSSD